LAYHYVIYTPDREFSSEKPTKITTLSKYDTKIYSFLEKFEI